MSRGVRLVCPACGSEPAQGDLLPFRCPQAGSDDGDHIFAREIDPKLDLSTAFSDLSDLPCESSNPFSRFRQLLHVYGLARNLGWSDAQFVDLVEGLDRSIAEVDGRGFRETPFYSAQGIGPAVWIKNETVNVAGSHKARHLFGILLYLTVADRERGSDSSPLAIASCGNAALAAAVVARAAARPLEVFVPADADRTVLDRLRSLGASIEVCARVPGEPGDPCYRRLQHAIRNGRVPFTVQGSENALALEGGLTLGYELAAQIAASGKPVERLYIQVGGGALASSVITALTEARVLGVLDELPRVYAVQTESVAPLERAFRILEDRGSLDHAVHHRSEYMRPWESTPSSIAHGILDDETYDWYRVVKGMLETGGGPVVVNETELQRANEWANELPNRGGGPRVDPTGSAGLAGVVQLVQRGGILPKEKVAVLLTGAER